VASEVDQASLLGPRRRRLPGRSQVVDAAQGSGLLPRGERRRVEPATFKDHFLVERDPHQLIEGVIIAAYALQVTTAFIFLRGEFALGLERVQQAVNDAYEYGALGRKIFGSDFSLDIVVHPGAGAYICGEETALLEALEGKRGFPRIKPPFFPAVIGLYGEPTVVNNVETMSNLPWIINQRRCGLRGTRWRPLHRYTALRPRRPGEQSRRLRGRDGEEHLPRPDLRPGLGGGVINDNKLKAIIPGGVSAPWFGPDLLDLPLGQDEVAEKPARCSARAPSWSWTTPPAWCAPRGASQVLLA
jgi:NADH-quinone oxidoreductase subunit F